MSSEKSESFKDSYNELQEIATKIRDAKPEDIDEIVPMVDKAVKNYSVCKERIEQVMTTLNEKMPPELVRDSKSED